MELKINDKENELELKVENIVVSTSLGVTISLQKIVKYMNIKTKPKQFPGLVYKNEKPKASSLIFGSGKIICTGSKSSEDANKVITIVVDAIKKSGNEVPNDYETKIENIVASIKLNSRLNLNKILLLKNIEYEPDQFPGLVYRLEKPKLAFLLFTSGKTICTGGKNIEDVKLGVSNIIKMFDEMDAYE